MNYTSLSAALPAALALASLVFAAAALVTLRRARAWARDCAALAAGLDAELSEARGDLDTLSRLTADQARRIRALEGRSLAAAEAGERAAADEPPPPPTITERRHRVMQLSRRGVECETIASILNMPAGEVELMVGLSRAY